MEKELASRRHVLGWAGAALTAALAGCEALSKDGSTTPTEPVYDHLEARSLFVADIIDIDVPVSIPTVDEPADADLLLFPADTGVGADQAIEWLDSGRVVALLGDGAQETWLDWSQSDAFEAAFGRQGYVESDPPPDLLVLVPRETGVTGHYYTWGSGYDDRDVLGKLEETFSKE